MVKLVIIKNPEIKVCEVHAEMAKKRRRGSEYVNGHVFLINKKTVSYTDGSTVLYLFSEVNSNGISELFSGVSL